MHKIPANFNYVWFCFIFSIVKPNMRKKIASNIFAFYFLILLGKPNMPEWTMQLIYLTKVSAHSWAVWSFTWSKLCLCRFSLSSGDIFKAWAIEEATSVIFQGFTKIAPAPKDWAAPANYKYPKRDEELNK